MADSDASRRDEQAESREMRLQLDILQNKI